MSDSPPPATPQSGSARGGANGKKPPRRRGAPDTAAKPRIQMQELNPYFGGACILAAIGAYITNAWEAAAALGIVGVAFLLYGRDLRPWDQIPAWKRWTVATMIFVGGAFLVVYVISLGGF